MTDTAFSTLTWSIVSISHIATGVGLFFIIRYFTVWSWLQVVSLLFFVNGLFGVGTVIVALDNISRGINPIYENIGWLAYLRLITGTFIITAIALITDICAVMLYLLPLPKKATMLEAYRTFMRIEQLNNG